MGVHIKGQGGNKPAYETGVRGWVPRRITLGQVDTCLLEAKLELE